MEHTNPGEELPVRTKHLATLQKALVFTLSHSDLADLRKRKGSGRSQLVVRIADLFLLLTCRVLNHSALRWNMLRSDLVPRPLIRVPATRNPTIREDLFGPPIPASIRPLLLLEVTRSNPNAFPPIATLVSAVETSFPDFKHLCANEPLRCTGLDMQPLFNFVYKPLDPDRDINEVWLFTLHLAEMICEFHDRSQRTSHA